MSKSDNFYKQVFIKPYNENKQKYGLKVYTIIFVEEISDTEAKIYNFNMDIFHYNQRVYQTKSYKWKYVEYVQEEGIIRKIDTEKFETFIKL